MCVCVCVCVCVCIYIYIYIYVCLCVSPLPSANTSFFNPNTPSRALSYVSTPPPVFPTPNVPPNARSELGLTLPPPVSTPFPLYPTFR